MINLYFDTEFTHFKDPLLPAHAHLPPAQLISIGAAGLGGERFYAENSEVDRSICSDFVQVEVLPHLEGAAAMPFLEIAMQLKDWLEAFSEPVTLWSDAPVFDWPFVCQLFDLVGWPASLERTPRCVSLRNVQREFDRFFDQHGAVRHHALWDARALAHAARIEDMYWQQE